VSGGTSTTDEVPTTIRAEVGLRAPVGSLELVVIGAGMLARHPLPPAGEVSLGRSPRCDICIDDRLISRRHALLHLGPPLAIEDLGSANGTRLRGQALTPSTPTPLVVGEPVDLGGLLVLVQASAGTTPALPRRVWSHGNFETRLEEEVTRAGRGGASLAVLRVHAERSVSEDQLLEALGAALTGAEIIGCYGPCEYELLVPELAPPEAEPLAERIRATLTDRGVTARVGAACFPRDGRDPYRLLERACELARGGAPSEARAERPPGIVIADPVMQQLYRLVERVAASNISVLILGETGAGKEVVAEALHRRSRRARGPFVRLNCCALTETLLENELFGHERGAFTGATQTKPGLLETAEGGTVFLDEVGELPVSIQVKLLRVLEERKVLRVGALKPRSIDVRFVSATNRDLEAEAARGAFRQDLFFRLNSFTLLVPALRQRPAEIAPLARTFAIRAARELGLETQPTLTPATIAHLERYAWPGNIRELRNIIERAVLLCDGDAVEPEHLPLDKMRATVVAGPAAGPATWRGATPEGQTQPAPCPAPASSTAAGRGDGRPGDRDGAGALDEEHQRIVDALDRCAGNQTRAARLLGISRRTLVSRLGRFGIRRPLKGRRG